MLIMESECPHLSVFAYSQEIEHQKECLEYELREEISINTDSNL